MLKLLFDTDLPRLNQANTNIFLRLQLFLYILFIVLSVVAIFPYNYTDNCYNVTLSLRIVGMSFYLVTMFFVFLAFFEAFIILVALKNKLIHLKTKLEDQVNFDDDRLTTFKNE